MKTYLINIFCYVENDYIEQIEIIGSLDKAIQEAEKVAVEFTQRIAFTIHDFEDYREGYECPLAYKNPNQSWIKL